MKHTYYFLRLTQFVNSFLVGFLCCSGMFEDNTFVYMIAPLELIHDEVSLTGHQSPYGVLFFQHLCL